MARVCAHYSSEGRGCPNYANSRGTYCNSHDPRPALYDRAWKAHSRERRASGQGCVVCGSFADLTVDHPTDDVICRKHHAEREAKRRRG